MTPRLDPRALEAVRADTMRRQSQAADPDASVWVSANAGTGKTHVLTLRVLRLLLAGTPPDRILCLTYTKAAAAEMSKRVFDRLSGWVTPPDDALQREIAGLLGRPAGPHELERARRLFTEAIETPGGLKVQTIHSFCERLLQRFPLEAGVPADFTILDDDTCRTLQRQAIDEVLTEATGSKGSPLGRALESVVVFASDDRFDELLRDALAKRPWIDSAMRLDMGDAGDALAGAEALYRQAFEVPAGASLAVVENEILALLPESELVRARDVLASGSISDAKLAACLATALAGPPNRRIEALTECFLTGRGEPRDKLMTVRLASEHPGIAEALQRAQERFVALNAKRGALRVVEATLALLRLASAVLQRYVVLKDRRAALDFDDLIRKSASLLGQHASAEWVLFKLDGGLDHILVDEAQDTSPAQWQIVEALAQEFFSGSGSRDEAVRTLFAVGDEKQSIYGFQGAMPDMFADAGQRFAAAARNAGQRWRDVPLTLSFRSVPTVLDAVDRVLAQSGRTGGGPAGSDAMRHASNRPGQAGLIEIWETERNEDAGAVEVWAPLDEATRTSPVARLSARIADTIRHWLDSGERLASENRAIAAGDILILVKRRRPFVDAMVTALKARGVPVAGVDRIELTQQLAVQDLIAIGDFVLLPEDDLALGALLKSPFFGLDDDDLFAIANGRRGSLWSALLAHADTEPRFAGAAETLKRWRAQADFTPPFEFFAGLLDARQGRRKLLARLGPEAADAIDEFLNLALNYDSTDPPSLQGFLTWLRSANIVIKRDMEHGRGEVRVMTIHGAKGLEAPIVFLPDTCSIRSGERAGGLVPLPFARRPQQTPEPFCWPVKGTSKHARVQAARRAALDRETEERGRLLYVALTRARDRLYVCGFEGRTKRDPSCWYDVIREALSGSLVAGHDWQDRAVWRSETAQEAEPERGRAGEAADAEPLEPPAWAARPARREPVLVVPLVPSRLAPLETDAEGEPKEPSAARQRYLDPPSPSPAAQSEDWRFLRGTLTHALLQYLPEREPAQWEIAARHFVDVRGAQLPAKTRQSIVAETLAVLREPAFAPLFGPGSIAEVPIVAVLDPPDKKGPQLHLNGQIDRLARIDNEVLIVDFKSNRPPPHRAADVPEAYTLQLAAYRLAVRAIFRERRVRAALLWTLGPHLMEIPSATLDNAEKRLFTLDRAALDAYGVAT